MSGFIDMHHHLVYGVDDGAQTLEQAMEMARAAAADGSQIVVGTSHVSPGVRHWDGGRYEERRAELNARCLEEGLDLVILPGAEILYTDATSRFLRERRINTLAGTDFVLVEFMPDVRYEALHDALRSILGAGYLPVAAHVERYACLANPRRCEALKRELGVLLQMNCSTAIGGRGFLRDRQARKLLDAGLIDAVASDAHHPQRRPTRMREAHAALAERYGAREADRLMGCGERTMLWDALLDAAGR